MTAEEIVVINNLAEAIKSLGEFDSEVAMFFYGSVHIMYITGYSIGIILQMIRKLKR